MSIYNRKTSYNNSSSSILALFCLSRTLCFSFLKPNYMTVYWLFLNYSGTALSPRSPPHLFVLFVACLDGTSLGSGPGQLLLSLDLLCGIIFRRPLMLLSFLPICLHQIIYIFLKPVCFLELIAPKALL